MNKVEEYNEKTFESIKHFDEFSNEYWEARELMPLLEYSKWENFHKVIKRAMIACETSNNNVDDHFPEFRKPIVGGKGNIQNVIDYHLSRYACYLIVQNANPRKKSVALGQTYFAIQTRKQEITELEYSKLSEDEKRLYTRILVNNKNKYLFKTAKESGVENFGKFNNFGYKGLYNGETAKQIAKRKKQIRKQYFSTGGMIVVSILGIIGLCFCLFSGILNIYDYESFYNCVSKSGMAIIFGGFFIIISIYCWIAFFKNIVLNPKKEILYLIKNENDVSIFVNKNGKKFIIENNKKKESTFYYVIKTRDYIYEVLDEECNLNEIWEEKKSYWLNFYSPMGNFEDIFLLPIAYVVLLPGILSILMSKGFDKIFGLIWSAVPLYVIGYDFVYKLKLNNNNLNSEDENKFADSYILLKRFIVIFLTGIIIYSLTNIFFKFQDSVSKIFFLPFYLCGILTCGTAIAKVFNKDFLYKLFLKSYVIIFLLFWFGFTTFVITGLIKQENSYMYILIGIPFYIFGIIVFKKYVLEK